MNQPGQSHFRSRALLYLSVSVAAVALVLLPLEALARVGGGQSYGGGGHSSGGGGGGGGALIWLIFQLIRFLIYLTFDYPIIGIPIDLMIIGLLVFYFVRKGRRPPEAFAAATSGVAPVMDYGAEGVKRAFDFSREFEQLRRFDPNFSEIIFTDFCYALYAKVHDARVHGAQALDLFSPYLSEAARGSLLQRNPPGLQELRGIIVGVMQVGDMRGLDTPTVQISVLFESNYTEVLKADGRTGSEMTYYIREHWDLERKRDVLSPPPAQATALHCPRCGVPLQKDTVGACAFCGTKIDSGEFQWYVQNIVLLGREAKGPLLTSDVPEVGTEYSTVVQPGFQNARAEFEGNSPNFSWGEFQERARLIFNELQAAWSTLDWERARPHETDNIFQMHRYWIEAYKRQGLRNALDQCAITAMQPVKIKEDTFYNAITLRIWAQGYDYTVNSQGSVVSGSKSNLRRWSEYWTFIRNRQAKPTRARADLNCPNCGAPLKVNNAGICEFCSGKITSGDFDWVLSKIEQDESYAG